MFILLCVTLEDIYHSTRTLFVAVQFENLNPENVVRCWTVVNRLESMRSSGASMRRNSPLTGHCTLHCTLYNVQCTYSGLCTPLDCVQLYSGHHWTRTVYTALYTHLTAHCSCSVHCTYSGLCTTLQWTPILTTTPTLGPNCTQSEAPSRSSKHGDYISWYLKLYNEYFMN